MDTNFNIEKNVESNVQFSAKLLNIVFYIGMIGALLLVLPYVFTKNNDFPVETMSDIGDSLTLIVELIFISLISYKLYKDGITKPSYPLLACYAGLMGLDFIVNLISQETGFIIAIIDVICAVGVGIMLLMAQDTRKIGMWLLLSMAGYIILFSIVFNEDFENTQKWVAIGLAAIYCYPFAKYLESCQKFLTGKENE